MATIAAVTGQKLENTDGISLLPTLLGKTDEQQDHDFLYWEYPENGGQIAIRLGKWKAVKLDVRKKGYSKTPWMIFDLENDRKEEQDLAAQHPELIKKFDTIVDHQHQPAHIKEWEFINPKFTKQ
jgi:arylsulfatase A